MTTFKPQDSKREEFRKYLERAGVMDAITKVFSSLYEEQEKPADALGYVYKALGEDRPFRMDNSNEEATEYATKIQNLEAELAEAKAKIQQLEEAVNAKKVEESPPLESPSAETITPALETVENLAATPIETPAATPMEIPAATPIAESAPPKAAAVVISDAVPESQ